MRLQVVAVGRLKSGPERELAERYTSRASALARGLGFSGPDIVELPESRHRRGEERQAGESTAMIDRIEPSALRIVFDERAPSCTSEAFAARLSAWRDGGRPVAAFLIGGPDGLASDLRSSAEWSVSFGRLTLPHQLVRVLALEQIYRAFTIIAGHPYHRAGHDGV